MTSGNENTVHRNPLSGEGLFLGVLRFFVEKIYPYTSVNTGFKWACRRYFPRQLADGSTKSPAWASETYIIVALGVAIWGFAEARVCITCSQQLVLLLLIWPIYRLYELAGFILGWVFVDRSYIHSVPRSLLGFLLNILEVAILSTTLGVVLSASSGAPNGQDLLVAVVAMVSIAPPTASESIQFRMELLRFCFGLVMMLCVLGSLAGSIVRRSLEGEKTDGA